ncbi:putative 2-succinyl-6-hydroxy-2,4-cyclohexadiene-1-carboxylate synthase [Shewanella sp. c952]|uniref:2-succinyl-6-hydroxy-2, 4-cyclohexadiene-1-carboxylate synthase n=1 Tax=Shewanella sp. c952 TaxID=2815913 RepID=UPI001BC2D5C3|nr:2-succinyl-6-hydroxy-2,4-cyclohexadiene-1-carboxylate synthase [Shewanella sp. c952]GIU11103.1 putative 2-succinyl-6-hydroxy-2,4-cyclohexadiene-1-carboxylate synthase [Shewanella sp. c952]
MLSYRCQGQPNNPAIVLLHGFLGDKQDWLAVTEVLAEQYYCISIDLPGHGDTLDQPLPTPGFETCCALIEQTVSKLGIEQYHLIGYSLGGRIALHLARRYPGCVLSLILESCHPGLQSEQDKTQRKINDALWADKLAHLDITAFLTQWYQQAVFADLSSTEQQTMIKRRSGNQGAKLSNCYQATSLAQQADLWDTPAVISAPCFFIAGSDDNKFLSLATRWQQQYPLKLYPVNASGHNVHSAAPDTFSQLVLRLLKPLAVNPILPNRPLNDPE